MATLSGYLREVRSQAETCLLSAGSGPEVHAAAQEFAKIPLPLTAKYRLINLEELIRENCSGKDRKEGLTSLLRALSVLEKYGCNLANPKRPIYWRRVKHNNPVFRATVDAIKGGRTTLHLYGYTIQGPDGLSFPDDVTDPDMGKVIPVIVEVMALCAELDLFIKEDHAHPEFLERIISGQQEEPELFLEAKRGTKPSKLPSPPNPALNPGKPLTSPTPAVPTGVTCTVCGKSPTLVCPSCGPMYFCENCDDIYHLHPERSSHSREKIPALKPDDCTICGTRPVKYQCPTCVQRLCLLCDELYHSHPDRKDHQRIQTCPEAPLLHRRSVSIVEPRATSERPRLLSAAPSVPKETLQPVSISEWECKSCTAMNLGNIVLCLVCERPRLATRQPADAVPKMPGPAQVVPGTPRCPVEWACQQCTFLNPPALTACDMCGISRTPAKPRPPSPPREFVMASVDRVGHPMPDPDLRRQKAVEEESLRLIQYIKEGEKKGWSPEEVYAAMSVSSGSDVSPCDWLESELPLLLDEICAMAASAQQDYETGVPGSRVELQNSTDQRDAVKLSRAEAKQSWVAAGGDTDKAVQHLLRRRRAKVLQLRELGFEEEAACEEALCQSGGDVQDALTLLQRPLLELFHQRVWTDQPPAQIDLEHPDKQWLCRRLLALHGIPSWGRCELALSLLLEPDVQYTLEDVVLAVKASPDRDFIRRTLKNECPICTNVLPRNKMQPLTSCQCLVCCECFKENFTIAVRDKHIRDMVCPVCGEPDLNDTESLNMYFALLDTLLRKFLEPEMYALFHTKMTEHTLMKDPNFRWCAQVSCSFGFFYDGNELEVVCPQCQKSFCTKCKKPWEPQHAGVSCEAFQAWKRENDPEYQKQGLAGYLRDNGITCPNCSFQYALSKGGCIHFTCSQCRYQFCSGCNNPFFKTTCEDCNTPSMGIHAHHPRDCLFYIRDWETKRLQDLLQMNNVKFNTEPPTGARAGECGVLVQKDEGDRLIDSTCGLPAEPGEAGLCWKHYREYLVSLINNNFVDPAPAFNEDELAAVCRRHRVDLPRDADEEDQAYRARLLQKLMTDVPLGIKVPRMT